MGFLGHELTVNPEVQEKLFAEIQDMEHDLDGKMINYEQIQSLRYMDQVVCETLRKWPAAPVRKLIHQKILKVIN
jgi:cytochrome P450 family 9